MHISVEDFITFNIMSKQVDSKNNTIEVIMVLDSYTLTGIINSALLVSKARIPVDLQGIYIIRQISTGYIYIGSTSCMCKRKSLHIKQLQIAFNENDVKDFEFRYFIVNIDLDRNKTRDILFKFEQYLLNIYHGNELCLNTAKDVKKPTLGIPCSEDTKNKLSEARKGILKSEDTKINMAIAQQTYRANLSEEEKERRKQITIDSVKSIIERPIYGDGRGYRSTIEAAKALGVSNITIYRFLNSLKYRKSTWNYVDELWDVSNDAIY